MTMKMMMRCVNIFVPGMIRNLYRYIYITNDTQAVIAPRPFFLSSPSSCFISRDNHVCRRRACVAPMGYIYIIREREKRQESH